MPSKDKRDKSRSWFFRSAIPTAEGMCKEFVIGLFRGREQYQSISLPCLHTVTFSVPAQHAASSDGNVVCGFVRGTYQIAESAVREWLPGREDTSGIHFEWTPIHGRFEQHELIKTLFSEIESNLTTRVDYVDEAPKKKMGRPRLTTHCSTVQSSSSSNPSMEGGSSTSLQPQTLSALETLPLTEIMQGNHLRTLRDADVCVRRLGHELHLLERQCLSDVVDARLLLRDLLRICALQDHILTTADSLPREESISLRSKVIKAAAMQLATRIFRLHAWLSSRPVLSSVLDFDEPASNQSTNPIEPSLQSSLPIHASLLREQTQQAQEDESASNMDNSSTQEKRSSVSLGSATSALGFQARLDLDAQMKLAQKERDAAEKAKKELDYQIKIVQEERAAISKREAIVKQDADREIHKTNEKLKTLQAKVRKLVKN